MITLSQLKLNTSHTPDGLEKKIAKTLKIKSSDLLSYEIFKRSIDSRDQDNICYVYSIEVAVRDEQNVLKKCTRNRNIVPSKKVNFEFSNESARSRMQKRPVIVGAGPAGLFAAYELASIGLRPLVIERGKDVDGRKADVEKFWNGGELNTDSNVQFGLGGAGAFSDGKLNTQIKDPHGIARHALKKFVEFGAPEDILYDYHPHIGTDRLEIVLKNMVSEIEKMGGKFKFETKLEELILDKNNDAASADASDFKVTGIRVSAQDLSYTIETDVVILAIGHSARDTFEMLAHTPLEIHEKPFAVGLRIQHPQRDIDIKRYGRERGNLPPADYKLTHKCESGRGVYSFCMCPGGYVVNASSEAGRTAINGMSYLDRAGDNANSAIIVTIKPDDYKDCDAPGIPAVLNGMNYQRRLEENAYALAHGKIPVQLYGDFKSHKLSSEFGSVKPQFKGEYEFARVDEILGKDVNNDIIEGIEAFENNIGGYARADAILAGVESRTSSPIRIVRDENCKSCISGLYPCGEGAGYAGGIMSAAVDGIKVALHI